MQSEQEQSNYWNFSDVHDITSELRKVAPVFDWRRGNGTLLEWLELEASVNGNDNDGDN